LVTHHPDDEGTRCRFVHRGVFEAFVLLGRRAPPKLADAARSVLNTLR
jgi:hypothetical protein